MAQGIEPTSEELEELKAKVLEYLSGSYGRTLFGAGQQLGYKSPSSIYAWMDADPVFKDEVDKARKMGTENALDLAENGSMKLLQSEDPKHIRWFLDRKGAERGYKQSTVFTFDTERQQAVEDAKQSLLRGTVQPSAPAGTDSPDK